MHPDDILAQHEQTFARNIDALRQVDPHLSATLTELPLPDHVKLATGRDGAATYRLQGPDGAEQWFGRTSMPTVSARGILASFDPGDANVALPGIGSGQELRLLARWLGPHQAIFVLEADPVQLKLALRLHDLTGPLVNRRVVLICGDDAESKLIEFCHRHEGFHPPSRMLGWPWQEPAVQQHFSDMLSRAGKAITPARNEALVVLRKKAADCRGRCPLPESPRLAVLSVTPNWRVSRLGEDLLAAAEQLAWPCTAVLMNTPMVANMLPHIRAVTEPVPDLAVLLGHTRRNLPVMPDGVPAITWLAPGAAPDGKMIESLGPDDGCVVMTSLTRRRLIDGGLSDDRILALPPAANLGRFGDAPPEPGQFEATDCDVAMIAEAANVDPEACGLKLTTHQALWRALDELIRHNVDRYHDALLEELFKQAERRSSVKLSDQQVRSRLMEMAGAALAPTLLRLVMIQALREAGVRVGLWGAGWGWCKQLEDVYHGSVVSDAHRLAIYRAAGLALVIEPGGRAGQELFDAVACRAAVLTHVPVHRSDFDSVAALFELGGEVIGFADRGQLVAQVGRLLTDGDARGRIGQAAHDRLTRQHLYSHRLEQFARWLRARSDGG
ncbi:MAG TPA: glycosyltransferase [Phycisphaerae bacterium]|nr:glycosyltransferase [Phycisphaerae bacterium]